MNLEHLLIKLFLSDTESYTKNYRYINHSKHNNIYTKIYHTLSKLKEDGKSAHAVEDLALKFHILYPVVNTADGQALENILTSLGQITVAPEQTTELLTALRTRKLAEDIALSAVEVATGVKSDLSAVRALLEDTDESYTEETDFVTNDIVEIRDANLREPPFQFRLKTLNSILGGLRRRTFGFIFARPETGKTHLLVSEATFLASQVPVGILWVNNEEDGVALITRAYQAALLKPSQEIFKNAEKSRDEYNAKIGDRLRIYDKPTATTSDIELVVRQYKPDIVFIDQLDKVRQVGKSERYDLQMKAVYQWARELAKKYNCAVVGICQAGGTAENKRFLDMNDVDSSHTAKQGEADWMFGLGRTDRAGEEDRRFVSVCKNKLPPVPHMVSSMRHAKVAIKAIPEIQIYEDVI